MKIGDIQLSEVLTGLNWRFAPDRDDFYDQRMEDWASLSLGGEIGPEDMVVYSGLVIYPSGRVKLILLCKCAGDPEYGGDYCSYVDGKWIQSGLVPNPNAEVGGREYFADPLSIDPSFVNDEIRADHRVGFRRHILGFAASTGS